MANRSDQPLAVHKLRLVEGDFQSMGVLFPNLGPSTAIRVLVHNYVKRVKAATSPIDLDLPDPTSVKDLIP